MEKSVSTQLLSIVSFAKSFHLYSRYQMAKTLKSSLIYEGGFGDKKILKLAKKKDFLQQEKDYQNSIPSETRSGEEIVIDNVKNKYGGLYAFEDKGIGEIRSQGFVFEYKNSEPRDPYSTPHVNEAVHLLIAHTTKLHPNGCLFCKCGR